MKTIDFNEALINDIKNYIDKKADELIEIKTNEFKESLQEQKGFIINGILQHIEIQNDFNMPRPTIYIKIKE